ncbi:cupin [Coxiella burnetii]|uniref:Cupin superfamily protein n=2 Tax=Coxiella burnetii TaxID=777 RepID=A9KEX1_COXBN|nr:cupin superfamily protein [Coxiella burnetii Dugway 5J108-111]OYK81091.1 cupin [Coxiella burnetii]OYK83182.1 cupin [Coxiella burnetii]
MINIKTRRIIMRSKKHNIIEKYGLESLPEEGGHFKLIEKSDHKISVPKERYESGERYAFSLIYYCLGKNEFSAWHRLKSDEEWQWQEGGPLNLYMIVSDGTFNKVKLSPTSDPKSVSSFVVPKDTWFSAFIDTQTEEDCSLVTCKVTPAFEWEDFEIGNREELIKQFPQHAKIIKEFSRTIGKENDDDENEEKGEVYSRSFTL